MGPKWIEILQRRWQGGHFEEPADLGETIGPVKPRKAGSGAILRSGKLIRFWGDVDYVDMSFSISKSFLSLCTGVAVKNGIISDVHEPVRNNIENVGFVSSQNKDITWAQMLQLTSEWEGTLWGKSDRIDHNRDLSDDVRSKFKKVRNENSKSRERIGNIMTSELII